MMWRTYIKSFKAFLQLEKGLSDHSIAAYLRDVEKLIQFLQLQGWTISPAEVQLSHLQAFVQALAEWGLAAGSQARIISGLKSFFKFCVLEEISQTDPSVLLESPKLRRSLPDVLSFAEIESMINAIDLSKPEGTRNKAILEVLYSCGLRVSELVGLKISQLYLDIGFIRVIGKGDKERLIPIGRDAIKYTKLYLQSARSQVDIKSGHEDFVFLNRRGTALSRVMIFYIIKELAAQAKMMKEVSPHTFRHSFATHLVEGGADLRAVQEMLGHESITTTEIYTHLDRAFLRSTLQQYHPAFKQK